VVAALAIPPLALAASGGAGIPSQSAGVANPAPTSTVSGEGITVTSRVAALLHGTLWVSGTASSARDLVLQAQKGGAWTTVASAHVTSTGSFQFAFHPTSDGAATFRVALTKGRRVSPPITVAVYRPSIATLYGPGLYGRHTACGEKLTRHTLGVANRKLKCGTRVSILYRGRTIVVPVIDRGPYANHANWDLTMATGSALGMNQTATVGALPQ
jgi:rare lipoprotein A (peptidoglycan hydrolase)